MLRIELRSELVIVSGRPGGLTTRRKRHRDLGADVGADRPRHCGVDSAPELLATARVNSAPEVLAVDRRPRFRLNSAPELLATARVNSAPEFAHDLTIGCWVLVVLLHYKFHRENFFGPGQQATPLGADRPAPLLGTSHPAMPPQQTY